jgi:hypothetical protein
MYGCPTISGHHHLFTTVPGISRSISLSGAGDEGGGELASRAMNVELLHYLWPASLWCCCVLRRGPARPPKYIVREHSRTKTCSYDRIVSVALSSRRRLSVVFLVGRNGKSTNKSTYVFSLTFVYVYVQVKWHVLSSYKSLNSILGSVVRSFMRANISGFNGVCAFSSRRRSR